MKKHLLIIAFLTASLITSAQFTKTFDFGYYDKPICMFIDGNQDIILSLEYRQQDEQSGSKLIKLTADANFKIWEQDGLNAHSVIEIKDGNYCITDKRHIRKIDQYTGEILWTFPTEDEPMNMIVYSVMQNDLGDILARVYHKEENKTLVLSDEGHFIRTHKLGIPVLGDNVKHRQMGTNDYLSLTNRFRTDSPLSSGSLLFNHSIEGTTQYVHSFPGFIPNFVEHQGFIYLLWSSAVEDNMSFVIYKERYLHPGSFWGKMFYFKDLPTTTVDFKKFGGDFVLAGNMGNHIYLMGFDEELNETFLQEYNLNFRQNLCKIAFNEEGELYLFGNTFYDESLNSDIFLTKTNINDLLSSGENSVRLETKVFPNPTSQTINIETEKGNISVEVFSVNGQSVKAENLFNKKMDISRLPDGTYFLKIKSDGEIISTQKIIKE